MDGTERLLSAIRKRFGAHSIWATNESQIGDFGEHLNDKDFYLALKEIPNDLGIEIKETDYLRDLVEKL